MSRLQKSLCGVLSALGLLLVVGLTPALAQNEKPDITEANPNTPTTPAKPAIPITKTKTKKTKSAPSNKARTPQRGRRNLAPVTVLVLPVETKGGTSDQLVDDIVRVEERRLNTTGDYEPVLFRRSLATIRRALNEQTLSAADVQPPFVLNDKIKRVAMFAGYSIGFVSSIDTYEYNADKHTVTLEMSAKMVDFSGQKVTVRAASESLTGSGTGSEVTIALNTVRDLTEKLMTSLLTPKPAPDTPKQ